MCTETIDDIVLGALPRLPSLDILVSGLCNREFLEEGSHGLLEVCAREA